MAIVLDINILCNKRLDENIVSEILNDNEVTIETINCIDNWMWDNEQKIELFSQVEDVLNNNKIIILKLKKTFIKDMGVYIEKIDNFYLYNIWINTDGYPMLDCNAVTSENSYFYEAIYQTVSHISEKNKKLFRIIGIGLETDFHYNENLADIINNSRNMVSWILDSDMNNDTEWNGYSVRKAEGLGMIILEKS